MVGLLSVLVALNIFFGMIQSRGGIGILSALNFSAAALSFCALMKVIFV